MHGMLDHHARIGFARERAETLRNVMLASRQRRQARHVGAGRLTPARTDAALQQAPRLRAHRGAV